MKTKRILITLGICLTLILLVAFIYALPFLNEFPNIKVGVFSLCIGSGCELSGAGTESCAPFPCSNAYCTGYSVGIFCLSDLEKYCKVAHPFESIEKCGCEALKENEMFRDSYRKFCDKNKVCYTNSWEYEFGCGEDMQKVCKKAEEIFTSPNACESWCYSAASYDLVNKCSECSNSWLGIYIYASNAQRENIFNKELKDECTLLCKNCNSSLCNQDNICEYVLHPLENITTT